ncbi:DUF4331 family protein [Desulfomonile tiedjei]|uniref:DUF4331 domain-containing protein n=1 Tax=Desulfomonile tiedjei (strain ATCC 49306 / DSM 6799 / DCB-1) TaxID=706587 RepID=I4C0W1_DESTA|nr:DUF4331 family protein [Desulfomonile tiedjei]AFM23202.1 hypothetical protein Desti_0467 [Desulfomonile tiedjei DSM 6799]
MSNHFTGLNLGPPEGDTRLDLTDLYAFQVPTDPSRTVLILNCNSFAKGAEFHPDAVYRINIDNDSDAENDISFVLVFSERRDNRQLANVYLAKGADARQAEPAGELIFKDIEVSFGSNPRVFTSGPYKCFLGLRSDAFFIDFAGILNMFDHEGGKNFTGLEGSPDPNRWTGKDLFANYNVFSMAFEVPTSLLGANPRVRIWGRVSIRRDGELIPVDRAGHPTFANFFFTDEVKPEFDRSEPVHDRERFLDEAVHSLEHVGDYSDEEARAAIDAEGLLPDMLSFDPSKPGGYPNGRLLTDHVVARRLSILSHGKIPTDGLKPHSDLLFEFPYLGTPHEHPDPPPA